MTVTDSSDVVCVPVTCAMPGEGVSGFQQVLTRTDSCYAAQITDSEASSRQK